MGVGDEGFDVIGGDAGATGKLGGVEGVGDEVGVQQDVAGGSQGLRGVYFRVRGELDQFHNCSPCRTRPRSGSALTALRVSECLAASSVIARKRRIAMPADAP
ncbi:hypothetical protein GCM10027021_05150 [Dyella kyungheensis]